jgi:CheY-like chemotaxis protein
MANPTTLRDRILMIDDDPSILTGLEALLGDEWDVRTATSGRDAARLFAEFSPDVVLLDVGLPDVSGIDLLHQFKMYAETTAARSSRCASARRPSWPSRSITRRSTPRSSRCAAC